MSRKSLCSIPALLVSLCLLSRPALAAEDHGHEPENEHAHGHASEEASAPVRFEAGRGLNFSEESAKALGLSVARAAHTPVRERTVIPRFEVDAIVFKSSAGHAQASTFVSFALATQVEHAEQSGLSLLSVQRGRVRPGTPVELVLALSGEHKLGSSVRVVLSGQPRHCASIPVSALLSSAEGAFVYLLREDGWFLRTAIRAGGTDGDTLEIIEGLRPGDVVVSSGVELLWLTELRLTKGGGHSH